MTMPSLLEQPFFALAFIVSGILILHLWVRRRGSIGQKILWSMILTIRCSAHYSIWLTTSHRRFNPSMTKHGSIRISGPHLLAMIHSTIMASSWRGTGPLHLDHEMLPDNSMAHAEKWAASMPVPAYAIDDQTAIKMVDGLVEVVSEGRWKR